MLSIVIPALNEEKYLPSLLDSIKKQDLIEDYEIIIADAFSEDKTREIAEKENCKVVLSKGELPAEGKNRGAESANGDLLFFVDADAVLPDKFLKNALEEFKTKKLDVASFCLKSENRIHNFIINILYNFPSRLAEKFLPQAMGAFLAKKKIHKIIGCFNEEIKIGEELDYVRRGAKVGKFGVLKSTKVFISSRRFQKDGWFKTWFKYFFCQLHMLFLGPVKSDILKYRFNHYSQIGKKKL